MDMRSQDIGRGADALADGSEQVNDAVCSLGMQTRRQMWILPSTHERVSCHCEVASRGLGCAHQ